MSIVETRRSKGLHTFTTFVDFSKAYDMIPRSHLWHKLVKTGINSNILKAIQALYNNVRCSVKINNCFTKSIDVTMRP